MDAGSGLVKAYLERGYLVLTDSAIRQLDLKKEAAAKPRLQPAG